MVNGDIDNCDVARHAVVDAITPARLGLSLTRGVAIGICASSATWKRAMRHWRGCINARRDGVTLRARAPIRTDQHAERTHSNTATKASERVCAVEAHCRIACRLKRADPPHLYTQPVYRHPAAQQVVAGVVCKRQLYRTRGQDQHARSRRPVWLGVDQLALRAHHRQPLERPDQGLPADHPQAGGQRHPERVLGWRTEKDRPVDLPVQAGHFGADARFERAVRARTGINPTSSKRRSAPGREDALPATPITIIRVNAHRLSSANEALPRTRIAPRCVPTLMPRCVAWQVRRLPTTDDGRVGGITGRRAPGRDQASLINPNARRPKLARVSLLPAAAERCRRHRWRACRPSALPGCDW